MPNFAVIAQVIVALSVLYVWIFRLDTIEREFKEYQVPPSWSMA